MRRWFVRLKGIGTAILLTGISLTVTAGASLLDANSDSLLPFLYAAAADTGTAPLATPPVISPVPIVPPPALQPGIATTLAIVPGFLVHGSGHFYAGRPGTGALLAAAEVGAVYMAYRGTVDILDVTKNADPADPAFSGDTGQLSRGIGLAAVGAVIFLGSWLYDLTGSPIAVMETEAKRREAARSSGTALRPQWTGQSVALVVEHRF